MTTPPPPPTAGPDADPALAACEDVLRAGWRAAPAAWGRFELSFERFAAEAVERARRRLARAGMAATPAGARETLARTAVTDLAVAIACSDGATGAWEALTSRLEPRLRGLARSRGLSEADAASAAADVLSEMSLPATQRGPRRLIATYEGAGSLFGWAAVILVRRLRRSRRGASRTETRADDDPALVGRADPRLPEPHAAAEGAESVRRLEEALAPAWARLDGRERFALVCRFVDGRPQTRIARLLGVSEPHTSRILARAVEKLRAAIEAATGGDLPGPTADAAVLVEALRRGLVSNAPFVPLPSGRDSGPERAFLPGPPR